jgi:5'-phosphate synthase pdxT subunit
MEFLKKNIGVLSFLGPFKKHLEILKELDTLAMEVKNLEDLESIDALIIPGTEIASLHFALTELLEEIKKRTDDKMPLLLTGEASILLDEEERTPLSFKNMRIEKHKSPQESNFEEMIKLAFSDTKHFPAKFLRSPSFIKINKNFKNLAYLNSDGEEACLIESGNIIATSFYPEFCEDKRIHEYFITKI